MSGKPSTILSTSKYVGAFSNYGGQNTNKSVSPTNSEFQTLLEWEENQYTKGKTEVTYSAVLVLTFLSTENENLQLEDLPLADFGRLSERLLLSVRTKSVNETFVN